MNVITLVACPDCTPDRLDPTRRLFARLAAELEAEGVTA